MTRRHGARPSDILDEINASSAPNDTDDEVAGFGVGSRWIDAVADKEYVCLDATTDAAVWIETTVGGSPFLLYVPFGYNHDGQTRTVGGKTVTMYAADALVLVT